MAPPSDRNSETCITHDIAAKASLPKQDTYRPSLWQENYVFLRLLTLGLRCQSPYLSRVQSVGGKANLSARLSYLRSIVPDQVIPRH